MKGVKALKAETQFRISVRDLIQGEFMLKNFLNKKFKKIGQHVTTNVNDY